MYTTNDRFNKARKQAEVYRLLATVATDIAKNIDKVAGKIYNKRVIEVMDQIAEKHGCHVYNTPMNEIEVSAFNHRDYRLDSNCTGYIGNYEITLYGMDKTPGGKLRVNGEDLELDCQCHAQQLRKIADKYDGFEAVYPKMIKDLNEVMAALKGFKDKYDSTYRDLAGLEFSIRNYSDSSNYDVKWA